MTEAETPSTPSPAAAWALKGKRGRAERPGDRQAQDAARFLLMLSSSSAAAHGGGEAEDEGPGLAKWARGPREHECSVCPKRFRTGRALGGHMRCHWERDVKGRVVKKKMRKLSALGLGLELEFHLASPSPRDPIPPVSISGESGGEEAAAGDALDPGPPLLPY